MTEYQKFLLNNAAVSSGMLGEFSLEQKYILPKDIVEELVKLKKLIIQFRENEIRCVTKVGENTLNFVVNIFEDAETKKKYASLYFEEKYKFMNKDNVQQTFLINFCDVANNEYFDNLKKTFNLTTRDETQGKDISEESKLLEELIKNKKAMAKAMPGLVVLDDKQYVLEVLKMLKTAGPFGLRMQKLFKEGMANIKVDKNSAQYWIALKALLDSLLYENIKDCQDEEFKKWLEIINQNYIMLYMNKQKNINKPKEQQKVAKKSKSAAAKKSDPISLGKPKKKNKKKDKSKDKGEKSDSYKPANPSNMKPMSSKPTKKTQEMIAKPKISDKKTVSSNQLALSRMLFGVTRKSREFSHDVNNTNGPELSM